MPTAIPVVKPPAPPSPSPSAERSSWLLHRYALPAVIAVLVLGVVVLGIVTHASVDRGAVSVNTVAAVDAKRYAGQWFEIARTPNRFQEQCVGEVTAMYEPRPDGRIAVTNRCRRADGSFDSVAGLARGIEGDVSGARLEVSFLPAWLRWLPLGWGDYWVVELDPAYRLAVVSDRSGEYLWVLAREPRLRPVAYEAVIKRLRARGFPVQRLVRTTQRSAER